MSKDNNPFKTTFNIKKFITLCFKSWRVFVVTVLVCGFLAGVFALIRPPKEEVFAQLMLKEDSGSSSMLMAGQIARSFSLGDMFGGSSTTDNESAVLKSHSVFLKTAVQMGLNTSYFSRSYWVLSRPVTSKIPYMLIAPPEMADTLTRTLKFDIKRTDNDKFNIRVKLKRKTLAELNDQAMPARVETSYGTFVINTTEHYDPETTSRRFSITYCSYDAAASAYERIVNIYVPDRKSDFIDLSFPTYDPAFGKDLLTHIINNYVDVSNIYKADRSAESLRLVDERLASLAQELIVSENALEQFKKDNKLTDVEVDAQYLMTKTGALESSLLEAQTNYEVVKLTRDFITNPDNNYSLIPDLFMSAGIMSSDNGINLITQYNQLILERMELTGSAKSNNSAVKQLDLQIDALRANILTTIDRLYQNVSLTLRDLKGENVKNKSRLSELPTIERQYIVLKRDNLLQEQIYLFLLQQREELNMSIASRTLPAQVIDYPYVLPEPVGMTRKMLLFFGLLIGLMLGAVYVFFFKMRRCPISSRDEVDSLIKAPVLQSLTDDASAAAIAVGTANDEAIRHLRSDVMHALKGCDGNVVVVTSLHDYEGKTYVSTNLATSLAMIGKRVMLVDAALRTPAIASVLGIKDNAHILADYVYAGRDVVATSVPVDKYHTLDVLASTAAEANIADIVASERFAKLISTLSSQYDYVIIDSSRIDGYSDIYSLTEVADVTLVVCRAKVVSADDVDRINSLYEQGRLKRIAVVENGFR